MFELTYPRVECLGISRVQFLQWLNTGKYMHIERKTSMAQSKRLNGSRSSRNDSPTDKKNGLHFELGVLMKSRITEQRPQVGKFLSNRIISYDRKYCSLMNGTLIISKKYSLVTILVT